MEMEEHYAVREFLRRRTRRRERGGKEGESGVGYKMPRSRDRSARRVLYTSDEEGSPVSPTLTLSGDITNSLLSRTVGRASSKRLLSLSSTRELNSSTASGCMEGFYEPSGQNEVPALIPEEEEEEEGGGEVGDWLVDDVGEPPAKRSRRRSLDSMRTDSRDTHIRRQHKSRPHALRPSGRRVGLGDQLVVEITSDSEADPTPDVGIEPSTAPTNSSLPTNDVTTPADTPLRVRVKLEGKTYLIPCPRRTPDGLVTPVGWLSAQASERYYSQHGVRPELSLTTSDGALLSADDPLDHVLSHNEEVVGVVSRWHHPPLAERYRTSCRVCGTGEHTHTHTHCCHDYLMSLPPSPSSPGAEGV